MKQLLLSLIVFIIFNNCIAQDTLIYKDGVIEIVQMLDITNSSVKYQSWKDTNNVKIYHKSYPKVKQVNFVNGQKAVLNKFKHYNYKAPYRMRHNVSIDLFDINRKLLTISYQYSFPKKKYLTTRITVSTSFEQIKFSNLVNYWAEGFYSRNKLISVGFNIITFPFSETNNGFTIVTAVESGMFKELTYDYRTGKYTEDSGAKYSYFCDFLVGVGYYWNTYPHIALGISVEIGRSFNNYDYLFSGRFRLQLGYTFNYKK